MNFLEFCFYVPFIFFLIHELGGIFSPKKTWMRSASRELHVEKKYSGRTETEVATQYAKEHAGKVLFHLFYSLWSFLGLLSSSWFYMILLIAISFTLGRAYKYSPVWAWLDHTISSAIIIMMILHKFHGVNLF